ncbi:lasso peptide biosynthesis B2 protein [Desulfobacca acetoxidans]|uniref:Microcin J25-processing protein McjB C-terminal domain-containing protein n=1 Tax=Desulfobacca acetoxidans (strain ATCC 700848 / DSM 11109 / ASRB2) TaxID=880072 RepID=F2NH33_DESAR|nr:lasso peptide biosynthesis B2 protein [Desulfobacca acetoxidans]AEB08804.1 hypothetical protein Desac_0934 [Desulfobacca acetoxidans DSM 11109]
MSRLGKFLALSASERGSLLEAAFWLGIARLAILILPFRRIAPVLGRHMATSPEESGMAPVALLDRISWAVATASRHLPWDCRCLAQAIAGKAMLKRRGVSSTLYLGLAKEGEAQLQAHAWLRCGERILTGRRGMAGFTIIATFAEDGK